MMSSIRNTSSTVVLSWIGPMRSPTGRKSSGAVPQNPVRDVVVEDGAARLELEVVGEARIGLVSLVGAAQAVIERSGGGLREGGVALALDHQGWHTHLRRALGHRTPHA